MFQEILNVQNSSLFANRGIGHQYSAHQVQSEITKIDKIVYSDNGNRTLPAEEYLKRILPILPQIGATRIAEISQLSTFYFPVFQSTRPNPNFHFTTGLNSGAQGKGPTRAQAMISCAMETIESYCAEAKNVHLIRGSYNSLRRQHAIVEPENFYYSSEKPPSRDEPFMWTQAYSVSQDCEVLIPAETVFFPFVPNSFLTRNCFPSSSNGLASGATFLEAITHAVYEIIERGYRTLLQTGKLRIEALYENEIPHLNVFEYYESTNREYEIQLFSYRIPWIKRDMPMFYCILNGNESVPSGWGCAGNVDTAVIRAVSEAMQSAAVLVSGSREDMFQKPRPPSANSKKPTAPSANLKKPLEYLPTQRTLRLKDLKKEIDLPLFKDLLEEFQFQKDWLREIGCPEIFVANLSRIGIDVPVVKVVVPGIPGAGDHLSNFTYEALIKRLYRC